MHLFLVHGYLGHQALFWPMVRALRQAGYEATAFGYPSHRGDLEEHATALLAQLQRVEGPVAVVAHSMGGLIAHTALSRPGAPRAARLVLIATPHGGCAKARKVRGPLARFMSPAVRRTGRSSTARAHADRVGVILGTKDRVVRPHEAEWDAAHDQVRLPFGHNELLLRGETASAVVRFLREGRFETPLRELLG